tara:strand:+ start:248 stop:589 length:342 start_codon:yes stop_codon:yes gene_type:complete
MVGLLEEKIGYGRSALVEIHDEWRVFRDNLLAGFSQVYEDTGLNRHGTENDPDGFPVPPFPPKMLFEILGSTSQPEPTHALLGGLIGVVLDNWYLKAGEPVVDQATVTNASMY